MANEIQVKSELKPEISDATKTVEEKANKSKPFSRKRIILIVIFAIISITVTALTIKFVLDINWKSLFTSISNGFAQKIGILWFCLLFLFFIFQNWNNFFVIWIRLRKMGYKISRLEYWLLGFATSFFRAVTPSFLSDSFIMVWLKANGIPTYRVTSVMFTNTFMWQLIQYLVTFPSFVFVLVYRGPILATGDGIAVFTLLCIGIGIDTFSVLFMYLLCVSKKVHYGLSRVFNWFKKILHMKYHTKEEIALKYKEKAVIKHDFYNYMKDWKTTLILFLLLINAEVITYIAICWSMYFVQFVHIEVGGVSEVVKVSFNFGWAFNSANVSFTANRLNFIIPNGEGSLEYILRTYLTVYGNIQAPGIPAGSAIEKDIIKKVTDNSILVWRCFGAYLPAFFGFIGFVIWLARKINKSRKGKHLFAEEKENELNEVVRV